MIVQQGDEYTSKHRGKVLALFVVSFISLLFFIPFASAAKPDSPIVSDNAMIVDAMIYGNIKQNTDFILHINAYNATSGLNLSNSTTQCNVELYGVNGVHILRKNNVAWDGVSDWELTIAKGNLSNVGQHAIEVWCLGNGIGGSERLYFEVTSSGEQNNTLTILVLLVIAIGLLVLGFSIKDEWITALGGFVGTGLGLYIFLNGIGVYNNSTSDMVAIIIIFFSAYVAIRSTVEAIDK